MISVQNAEALILDLVKTLEEYEEVDLSQAWGRVLVQDIRSNLDFPHWHNSSMDGYAFCYADLLKFETLAIAHQNIPAGRSQNISINSGECIRIFTGGVMPQGTDTVIMQEDVEVSENRIKLKTIPKLGEYVRKKSEFYQAGTVLLKAGIKISAAEIGILAATQNPKVTVYRQPRVSIISTGNELRELSDSLQMGQIVDSNQYALSSLIRQAGAVPVPIGIVGDRPEDLSKSILQASDSDMVVSTGGVSVGDYDYVDAVLADLGADIHLRSCAIKPGKPLTVATLNRKLYFGVPGNPASVMVCFWRFINGAIAKLSGANSQYWYPKYIQAVTSDDLHAQGQRETYLWGYLEWNDSDRRWNFHPASKDNSGYSSGDLISWAGANGLAILQVNQTYIPRGELALIMMI